MSFVAIDFETGTYEPESAVSVGLVKFLEGGEAGTYYSLIRPPQLYIRRDFTAIHGLTVADVEDAPTFADIWERDILPFVGWNPGAHLACGSPFQGHPWSPTAPLSVHPRDPQETRYARCASTVASLVAHNSDFDMRVLRALIAHYGLVSPPLRYFCSLKIARRTWPNLPSRALTALAAHFGITYDAHNALDDARTCGKVLFHAAAAHQVTGPRALLRATKLRMGTL
jgi:DNA polymerase-3 subunit epsilon